MLCSSSGLCRFEGQIWLWLENIDDALLTPLIMKDLSIAILFIKPHVKIRSILKIFGICLWWTRRTCLSSNLGLLHQSLSFLAKAVLVVLCWCLFRPELSHLGRGTSQWDPCGGNKVRVSVWKAHCQPESFSGPLSHLSWWLDRAFVYFKPRPWVKSHVSRLC